MKRGVHALPRHVKPEVVEVGDTIRVTFAPDGGVTTTHVGIVGTIQAFGMQRTFRTDEGAIIFTYELFKPHPTVTLLARSAEPSVPLFEL